MKIPHFTGASQATLSADRARAISQTRLQRGLVHGVLVTSRHRPVLRSSSPAKRARTVGIVLRERMTREGPARPGYPRAVIEFDSGVLDAYPEGYHATSPTSRCTRIR